MALQWVVQLPISKQKWRQAHSASRLRQWGRRVSAHGSWLPEWNPLKHADVEGYPFTSPSSLWYLSPIIIIIIIIIIIQYNTIQYNTFKSSTHLGVAPTAEHFFMCHMCSVPFSAAKWQNLTLRWANQTQGGFPTNKAQMATGQPQS